MDAVSDIVAVRAPAGGGARGDGWLGLLHACSRPGPAPLAALYETVADQLYALALWLTRVPEDAADVVSDVFVIVAQQGAALRSVRHGRAWLLTVTRRRALDLVRARERRRCEPLAAVDLVVAVEADAERQAEASRLSALLVELPSEQREVLYLRHFADCSFAEIGRVTGVSLFTAASRQRLGLRRLRRLMGVAP